MVGKKDYRRWQYDDDETEISVEEQLTLEDHEQTEELHSSSTTFSQPTVTMNGSRIHQKRPGKITSVKAKMQLIGLSLGILLAGFIAGFAFGVRDKEPNAPLRSSKHLSSTTPTTSTWSSHEINESAFHKLVGQITAENIRHNLKRMSQEVHTAGTSEGRSMAIAIRDLWRSYGLSVRVEQHKALITKTSTFNYVEAVDKNGSVIYRSSQVGDDVNIPNARPLLGFSPPADLNGTLIYGHFGSFEDFQYLESQGVRLNRSIALIRYGSLHPSKVVVTAGKFGIKGIIFYPDPADFGPMMPPSAVRRSSILTLGQIHEFQEHKTQPIPCHTISANDAEYLFRLMMMAYRKIPSQWQGGLKTVYSIGGAQPVRLRLFNELKTSSIFNVVAAIPGSCESDRYVIVGASHDSWTYGASDPGVGLAILTEIARVFASSVQKGWKTRRSILFISWDANLYASSGVSHWLQEHHFEISSRAVAYIDLTRTLQGNQTLRVFSSPVLREVTKKAIARVKHFDSITGSSNGNSPGVGVGGGGVGSSRSIPTSGSSSSSSSNTKSSTPASRPSSIEFSSTVNSDEPSFAFLGNLGIPFIRLAVVNSPKGFDYPLLHTSFDTFENFRRLVDPNFNGSETLGRIISGLVVLLADSSLLPMNVEDYVEEIQKAFGTFMAQYHEDLHKANVSIAYLQAAVMRLEVIGDNFRTEMHNRSVIISNSEHEHEQPSHQMKTKKLLFHRIINDKLMGLDRAFQSRRYDVFRHLVLGYRSCTNIPPSKSFGMNLNGFSLAVQEERTNCSVSYDQSYNFHFPKLREALNCGRKMEAEGFDQEQQFTRQRRRRGGGGFGGGLASDLDECRNWKEMVAQEVASLIRALDAAAADLQSPLLPEESDSAYSS